MLSHSREAQRDGAPWFSCLLGSHQDTPPPTETITLAQSMHSPIPGCSLSVLW